MNTPYVRAPHAEGPAKGATHPAPNAALLIDFDNVTMGMRSDLSNELKTLLNSDIIRGKVAVQRAYADWRRYPQYIVPLSEASIDLIFAPAYGSNKKNATDIRMAIDALELVFIRPEIGTFILLTGDSDFSSLVLKLKEYGKYVIGVGIQESSSDILVQNCDEYYSYTSLAGLRKTTESDTEPVDPWILVERALERMEERKDVMRSDRLKQVMLEFDAGFDEGEYGFSKFSRFLTEASSRGLVELRKLDNGQYEVAPTQKSAGRQVAASTDGGGRSSDRSASAGSRSSGGGSGGGRSRQGRGRSTRPRSRTKTAKQPSQDVVEAKDGSRGAPSEETTLQDAYDLLTWAVRTLLDERGVSGVRDSDVKRKMLDRDRGFDEAAVGFGKFSLFLRQADDDGVIDLRQRESGNYEVALPGAAASEVADADETDADRSEPKGGAETAPSAEESDEPEPSSKTTAAGAGAAAPGRRTLGPRRGEKSGGRGRGSPDDGPPILEGQVVAGTGSSAERSGANGQRSGGSSSEDARTESARGAEDVVDPDDLGLPTDGDAVIRYLANSYRGVGEKTAEALVDEIGADLFEVLQRDPARVRDVVPANRAEQLLDAWEDDIARRRSRLQETGSGRTAEEERDERSGSGGAAPADESRGTGSSESDDAEEPAPSRLGRRRTRRTRR